MILLVGNLKGGTGKSTLSFNLAVWSALHSRRALLIDADPLHTVSTLLKIRKEDQHLPLIYSLISEEKALSQEILRISDLFDDIIVDIAAGDKEGFRAALRTADKVLIPLLPGQADVWALHDVLGIITEIRAQRPHLIVISVINKADTHPLTRETEEAIGVLQQIEGIIVSPIQIGYRVLMRRSFSEGMGVIEYEPHSKAALEINALAHFVFDVPQS